MNRADQPDRMEVSEIEHKVIQILREHCNVTKTITSKTRLAQDLNLDSVGLMTLALEVENSYELILGEDPNHPPQTVGEIVELVQKRLTEKALT